MITFGQRALAVLLVAASVGCSPRPAGDGQVSASSSPSPVASSSALSSTARMTAGSTPARTIAKSSVARPSVSRSPSNAPPLVPPVSAKAQAAGLVDVRTVVPDAIVDLRYASTDNFVGMRMYPADARCLVHESMAPGLKVGADRLRREGVVVVFWDCYRPHEVQVRMFEVVPDPKWVARPGSYATSHVAGRSVDITLAHAAPGRQCAPAQRVQRHCLLDMGTGFDDFSARAHAFATYGVSSLAQSNRTRLRSAMNSGGITVYSSEWWHFNGPGSGVRRPHLNAPLN